MSFRIVVERGLEMRTTDGVTLRADVYRPDADGRFPVILLRTPYDRSRDIDQTEAHYFAPLGYVVVVQDVRGQWGSKGEFYPRIHEAEDGYTAVEWVRTLPWSNGRVATMGQSYMASAQFALASRRPSGLVAASPVAGPMYLNRANGGLLEFGWSMPYFIYCARAGLRRAGRSAEYRERFEDWLVDRRQPFSMLKDEWFAHLPLSDWAKSVGAIAPYIADMVTRPPDDPFWQIHDLSKTLDRFEIPMFHFGSWYDAYGDDTITMYEGLSRRAANACAREGQRLVMGPWGHLLPFAQKTSGGTGDIDFGPEAIVDLHAMQQPFFDYHLKGDGTVFLEEPRVRIFVMGENRWRAEEEWPLARTRTSTLYLQDGSILTPERPAGNGSDSYVYDPAHPVRTRGGNGLGYALGVFDQRPLEARDDVLVYDSEVLTERLELTGAVEVELHACSSAVDTDFIVRLCDVRPDGYSHNICEGAIRARYRNGVDCPELLVPDDIYQFDIRMNATSHVFFPGHRLRLQVTSSNFPRFDRNLNLGEGPEGRRMITARQTIMHSSGHASLLRLPVIPNPST